MRTLDFHFDYACPWCYIGSFTVRELAKEEVAIRYHVWKMPQTVTAPPKPEGYYDAAQARLKELRQEMGVIVRSPVQSDTIPALIATKVADAMGAAERFVERVFRAHWAEKGDISDRDVLVQLAESVGLNPSEFRTALETGAGEAAFQADLNRAAEEEISTIPSYLTADGRIFVHHFANMPTLDELRSLVRSQVI